MQNANGNIITEEGEEKKKLGRSTSSDLCFYSDDPLYKLAEVLLWLLLRGEI